MTRAGKARTIQFVHILFALLCLSLWIALPGVSGSFGPPQGVIVLAALYCAWVGFRLQRKILHGARNARPGSRNTPEARWMVGNLFRMASAVGICCWGLLVHFNFGPHWLAGCIIGLGLILLLLQRPGNGPEPGNPTRIS